MLFDWDHLPSEAHTQKLYEKFEDLLKWDSYGFDDDTWNLTRLMEGPKGKRIRAFQVIQGDRVTGEQRPHLALKHQGMVLRFRLQVLTRQACCRTADGKEVVKRDGNYQYDKDEKVLVEFEDKPVPGDVVEWKHYVREARGEPHLSSKTITEWAQRGERMHHYEEFIVDDDLCITAPFEFAHMMMITKGFRMAAVRRFERMDPVKPGEKPQRRITNWWFKEVPPDFTLKPTPPIKAVEQPSNLTGKTGGGGGRE